MSILPASTACTSTMRGTESSRLTVTATPGSGSNGGDWINGRVQSATYFADSDTFGFRSRDSQNNYLTYANAPGTQHSGIPCSGNCDLANGYFESSNSSPGLFDLSPDQRIQQISIGVTADSQHSFGCIAQAYGVGVPGTAAYQLGQPVAGTKRFVSQGSSLGTSPISDAPSKAIPIKGSFRAPVDGPGTGVPFRMTKTGTRAICSVRGSCSRCLAAIRWLSPTHPLRTTLSDTLAAATTPSVLGTGTSVYRSSRKHQSLSSVSARASQDGRCSAADE